jgi:RNA-directed DNA polymerase
MESSVSGRCVESFAFLGYSFRGEKIYPRRESLAKLQARITELTPRKRPGSIAMIAGELNPMLIGWFGYFRHCRWTIYKDLDAVSAPASGGC